MTSFDNRDYWESRLREHYSLAGVGYLRLGRRYNQWMYRVRGEVFDRVISRLNRATAEPSSAIRKPDRGWKGRDVLDIGPGTGFYVERWLKLGTQVVGMDLAQVAVDELTRRFPTTRFLQADIGQPLEGVPLRPASFHAVSAFDVLFHIVDDAAYALAFRNIAALLRPGGWFIWSDNFLHYGVAQRVAHQASRPLPVSLQLVAAAGLEVVDRFPMFVLMNYPADTRSRFWRGAWTALVSPALLAEPLGWLVGAGLYPLERLLVKRKRESPSTEVMVCRKKQ